MTEIDEFKAKVRGEAEAAMERIREMQAQAAQQYREMQSNYAIFWSRRVWRGNRGPDEGFARARWWTQGRSTAWQAVPSDGRGPGALGLAKSERGPKMAGVLVSWVVAVLLLAPAPAAFAGLPAGAGVGVLGDSYSDEYQFYPPDRGKARNWVEILATTRGVNFGRFSTASRGEPRNQGYEFNWARSDATTDSLIATGQHTGLAGQVARGEVRLVFVFIAGNDFINALYAPDPARALRSVLPRAMANYRVIVRTVLDASPDVKLVLATLPDVRNLPEFAVPLREGWLPRSLADAYTEGMSAYNAQVRAIASAEPRAALLDLDLATRLWERFGPDRAVVARRALDRIHPANDLDHFFLADVRHPGTLGQGMLARMFVATVNARFDAGITPITDRELVDVAVAALSPVPKDTGVTLAGLTREPGRGPLAAVPAVSATTDDHPGGPSQRPLDPRRPRRVRRQRDWLTQPDQVMGRGRTARHHDAFPASP